MESSSAALWGHFKQIPQEKLQSHIILRFNSYDVDNSGTLDRAEMREVCVFFIFMPSVYVCSLIE
jgi:Ca2+-binding EF-hand superfamily protein